MKIAILTFHNSFNCGATLQAWALQRVLDSGGLEVEFPNLPELREISRCPAPYFNWRHLISTLKSVLRCTFTFLLSLGAEDVARLSSRDFRRHFLRCVDVSVKDLSSRYDIIIVGSDQVWNPNVVSVARQRIFLGEDLNGVRLVGYALSGGDRGGGDFPVDYLARLTDACRRYCAVSVREQPFAKLLRQCSGRNVPTVLDPTLLLDREAYREVEYKRRIVAEEFLFFYTVSVSWELVARVRRIAKDLGVRLIIASPARRVWADAWRNPEFVWKLSPDRFLAYVRDAKYVIASSFHGTVFAILYRRPFVSFVQQTAVQGRTMEILNLCSMTDRAMPYDASESEICAHLKASVPNPDCVLLQHVRAESYRFIEKSVFAGKETA